MLILCGGPAWYVQEDENEEEEVEAVTPVSTNTQGFRRVPILEDDDDDEEEENEKELVQEPSPSSSAGLRRVPIVEDDEEEEGEQQVAPQKEEENAVPHTYSSEGVEETKVNCPPHLQRGRRVPIEEEEEQPAAEKGMPLCSH